MHFAGKSFANNSFSCIDLNKNSIVVVGRKNSDHTSTTDIIVMGSIVRVIGSTFIAFADTC